MIRRVSVSLRLRSKCRKYKLEHDLKLIIIDYLQLMSGSGRITDPVSRKFPIFPVRLKALARELNVPVVALSQLIPSRGAASGSPTDAFRPCESPELSSRMPMW